MKVVIDLPTAMHEKLDRLAASDATEHAAILDAIRGRKVRLTSLENAGGATKPPTTT